MKNDEAQAEVDKSLHDPLVKLPGYALRRAANAMMHELSDRLAIAKLRVSEASVILLIHGKDDVTASEIGRILDIKRANMVPLLNRLESDGLVERIPINRKSFAIILSEHGNNIHSQVEAITASFETDLLDRIDVTHREHFMPALHALWR
jgi:DNA-binding MarR family transcriptional regulator